VVRGRDRLHALGHPTSGPGLRHERRGVRAGRDGLPGRPFVRQLVEPAGQPLGQPAGVGEDDRAAVGLDEVEHPLLDRGPDRRPRLVARRRAVELTGGLAQGTHVLDRDDDREVPLLGRPGRDHLHRAAAGEEGGHLLDGPYRRRQADPLRRALQQLVEPVEGDGQVRAALGVGDRVHLVDDPRLDAAQRLAGGAGEQEEQRLRRGDEDVGGPPGEGPPLLGRGVTGAGAHLDLRARQAQPGRGLPDTGERGAQVALDVDGQGLQG
jgi:hypothetical protein